MRKQDIEDSILSAILFVNDIGGNTEEVFKLDTSVFTSKYRQRVAEQINNVTDGFYGFLLTEIEEKTMGTRYEIDIMDIMAQTPMTLGMAKKYHDRLAEDARLDGLC